jgi:hypothetical protein
MHQEATAMFNVEDMDAWYDACVTHLGTPPMVALFDRRVVVPVEYVAERLSQSGRRVSAERVRSFVTKRWISLLPGATDGTGASVDGIPLYAVDRLEQYIGLSEEGITDEELAAHAEFEEWVVDECCTGDDLQYIDDDIDQLIADAEAEGVALRAAARDPDADDFPSSSAETNRDPFIGVLTERINRVEINLQYLRGLDRAALSETGLKKLERYAYRVRMRNEMIRVQLVQLEYEKMRDGWSFFVELQHSIELRGSEYTQGPTRPNWASTLRHPLATEKPARLPIRVPGFVLRGDQITPVRTLTPDAYRALWEAADLDEYLSVLKLVWSEKECPNCRQRLPKGAADQRVYCSSACANAARQARYRAQNPEAVKRSQNRWRRA